MKTYQIEICETSSRVIDVDADSADSAVDAVIRQYKAGNIVLDYNDFQDYEVAVIGVADNESADG